MPVITQADYKTWAGITGSDLDAWLALILPAAQSRAEEWCDREFDSKSRTEFYDSFGAGSIQLRSTPVTAVESVSYLSGTSSGVPSYTAFDSSSYWFDGDSGLLSRFTAFDVFPSKLDRDGTPVWPEGTRGIKVVYTGGYTDAPDGLKLAMYSLVDNLRAKRGKGAMMQSESMGSYSYTRAALTSETTDQLMREFGFTPYRRGMA